MEDRELELRERELSLKEREVLAKEREARTSPWLNPLVVAILAAAAGLMGNVIVALMNNRAADHTERVRAQSSLIQGIIKTDTNDATCKNLIFFVKLGMLDDPQRAIRSVCPSTEEGVPSLSPSSGSGSGIPATIPLLVLDADSRLPIEGALASMVATEGYVLNYKHTDKDGRTIAGLFPNGTAIRVDKGGYESVTMTRLELGRTLGQPQVIYMHKSKSTPTH